MNKLNIFSSYIRLPRSVYIIFIADIINAAGSFVYPFLTLFLTLKLGYSENNAGLLLTIVIAAEGLGRLLGGKLADKIGRKIIVIVLSLAGAVFFVVVAFLTNSGIIPVLIILASFLKSGAFPALNAIIIDITNKDNRNDAFSLQYLGHNIGFAIGPLTAGFLFVNHIRLIFLIDAFATVAALIPIILFVKDTMPSKTAVENKNIDIMERAESGATLSVFFKRPVLVGYAFISIVYSFVYAQSTFGLPLYLGEIFSENGPKIYGSLMTVNAVINFGQHLALVITQVG